MAVRIVLFLSSLFFLGTAAGNIDAGDPTSARPNQCERLTVGKRGQPMLDIANPQADARITFSQPLWGSDIESGSLPWTRLTVTYRHGAQYVIEDLSEDPMHAFYPDPNPDTAWSPDGRYLVVYRLANVIDETDQGDVVGLEFLDVKERQFVGFEPFERTGMPSYFIGWQEREPHTALMIGANGKTVRAFPPE